MAKYVLNPFTGNLDRSDGDPGAAGNPGQGVPAGGTTGQVLAKNSNANYDTEWVDDGSNITISGPNKILGRVTSGAGAVEEIDCTAAGRALLDDADAAAQRSTLGLDSAAQASSTDFVSATTTRAANIVLAGPATGSAAPPTFRALVAADMAALLTSTAPSNPAATAAVGTATEAAHADHVHQFQPTDLIIPLSGETSNLAVATVLTVPYWPRATVLTAIPIWMVNTAPTGAALQFDIRIGGTSIFSTLPTIAISGTNSTTTTAAIFSTAFTTGGNQIALGSSVTFHVTQIGSTVAGAGLKVALPTRRAG